MKATTRAILSLTLALLLCITFTAANAQAQEPIITGPVLVGNLPLEAEIITNTSDDQGNYLQELLVHESAIKLVTLRQKVDEAHPHEMPIKNFFSTYFADLREDEPITTNPIASYPAERIRFVTGGEEDTAVIDAVLIRTDEYYFAFWADTQIDIYYGYHDVFEEGEVPELIDIWIESLDLFDAGVPSGPAGEPSDEPPYWNGLDFGSNLEYAEEYLYQTDPGDYLSPAEAMKLLFDTMKDHGNIPGYQGDAQYTMTLTDIADIAGEECYVYRLDVNDQEGTVGAAYAYAYQTGSIYMQGQGGEWVRP